MVAPVGTPESQLAFSPASVSVASGSYSTTAAAPADSGDYTVHARTCWGNAHEPTCVTTTRDVTL